MQASLTVEDLVKFFLENRGQKFKAWTADEFASAVLQAIADKVFAWSHDRNGQLTGFALGVRGEGTIHIAAIIIKRPATLKQYIDLFRKQYPNFKLTGTRGNKLVDYRRIYGRRSSA